MESDDRWTVAFWRLETWPETVASCDGCGRLLLLLLHGWGLPEEDRAGLFGDEAAARRKRIKYLHTRRRARRQPTIQDRGEERPVHYTDDREVWGEASLPYGEPGEGVPDDRLEEFFPETDGPGRPRLHRWLTPGVLDGVLSHIEGAMEHLHTLPTADLADHFTDVYGSPWPPHLEEVHDVLRERWHRAGRDLSPGRRAYESRGTARRVATVLPVESYATLDGTGTVEVVHYRPCPWSYDQLRGLDRS